MSLAVAAVLGLMIGVFVAFFKEYWIKIGIEQKEQVSSPVYGRLKISTR